MIAMISQGLTAWIWDASGVRSASPGCTNPVWVAINTYLRAISLNDADAATQAATFDVAAAVAAAATADEVVASLFGDTSVANPSEPTTDVWTGANGVSEFCLAHAPISLPSVTVAGVSATVSQLPDSSGAFTWDGSSNLIEATSPVVGTVEVAITYVWAETYSTVMGTENQFRFKGTVDPSKPTRDWLRDILNNNLGYFTWSFGALKIGCRNTSTPVSTFHAGNMLFNSLRLDPFKPRFEKLTIDFADEEYQFAHNTVVFTDQDYAARYGRVANPRASEFGLVGSSTKSQAMRVAVCRTREELGGVGATEQTQARNATWRSTVLALDVDAGAVVLVADSELSGGSGTFRLQSWRLNRDWSVDLVGKTVRPSMYDLTAAALAPSVTAATPVPAGARDSGPPPAPAFAARVSLVDASSLEIYGLGFAQTTNTRTITSATFTISFSGGGGRYGPGGILPPGLLLLVGRLGLVAQGVPSWEDGHWGVRLRHEHVRQLRCVRPDRRPGAGGSGADYWIGYDGGRRYIRRDRQNRRRGRSPGSHLPQDQHHSAAHGWRRPYRRPNPGSEHSGWGCRRRWRGRDRARACGGRCRGGEVSGSSRRMGSSCRWQFPPWIRRDVRRRRLRADLGLGGLPASPRRRHDLSMEYLAGHRGVHHQGLESGRRDGHSYRRQLDQHGGRLDFERHRCPQYDAHGFHDTDRRRR